MSREPLSTLPNELWMLIASFVENRNDLFALCGTSTILRAISLPLFFKAIDLSQWEGSDRKQRCIESLRNPDLALFVTDLQVLLESLHSCHTSGGELECLWCTTVDNIMGDALLAMANLESLSLSCSLCGGSREPRHAYIDKLVAPRLRAFNFDCRCCRDFSAIIEKRVLSLASLATVRSFSCHVPGYDKRDVLEDPNVLPLLRNLQYQGSQLDRLLLSTRPIERLHLQQANWSIELNAAIDLSPGKLTYLITKFFETRFFQGVSATTCNHLQHIGTFSQSEVQLLSHCPPMDNVTTIDVWEYHSAGDWSGNKCSQMRTALPRLQKVLIHTATHAVWELKGQTWVKRKVDPFTVLDILRGACDNL